MPDRDDLAPALADALTARYGRPSPFDAGLDPFEAAVAVLLDRALDAPRVGRALDALRDAGLLDPQALAESDPAESADALRSAGLKFQDKALAPLRKVARWLVDLHHGAADELAGDDGPVSAEQLREELTAINGIGPKTADALLLFAFRRPRFPLDHAAYRILLRHGWTDPTADYDEARSAAERLAPDGDAADLARLSHWLDRVGRDFCKASAAKCENCPLRPFLPPSGPVEPGDFG